MVDKSRRTGPGQEHGAAEGHAVAIMSDAMSLRELRKAADKTQIDVGHRMRLGQDSISKIEARTDVLISTLREYLSALGGELDLVARLPGRPPVRLTGLTAPSPYLKNKGPRSQ